MYNLTDVIKLDYEHACGKCGSDIVGYCNNDSLVVRGEEKRRHVDLFGVDGGDYFYSCTNDACLHHIGIYEFSGIGYGRDWEVLESANALISAFYKTAITDLWDRLVSLKHSYKIAEVEKFDSLLDEYRSLQDNHSKLIRDGNVSEAVAMVNDMVELNLQIKKLENMREFMRVPTQEEIDDIKDVLNTLLVYSAE